MKSTASVLVVTLLLAGGAAQAQLYKWTGPDGKVTYSDVPPPKAARQVEQKEIGGSSGNAPSTAGLPYELAQAVRNHPVTLYTGEKCEPCDEGRNYLRQRGIPFSEKTVTSNDDIARLRQVAGDSRLPFVTIGRDKHTGFNDGTWGPTLTAAGYPQTSMLPRTWRQPAAEAAAPKAKIEKAAQREQASAGNVGTPATSAPPAVGNAPPGFRF